MSALIVLLLLLLEFNLELNVGYGLCPVDPVHGVRRVRLQPLGPVPTLRVVLHVGPLHALARIGLVDSLAGVHVVRRGRVVVERSVERERRERPVNELQDRLLHEHDHQRRRHQRADVLFPAADGG